MISDLYGGTTSNTAIYLGIKYNLNAISGLSLPVILEIDKEEKVEKILEVLFLKQNKNVICVNLIEEFKLFRDNTSSFLGVPVERLLSNEKFTPEEIKSLKKQASNSLPCI